MTVAGTRPIRPETDSSVGVREDPRPAGWLPWFLVAATLLAFGLRVWRLYYHSYRGDETFVVWFVAQDWGALVAAIARNEPHPPLYYLITKLWRDVLGDGEFVFRF